MNKLTQTNADQFFSVVKVKFMWHSEKLACVLYRSSSPFLSKLSELRRLYPPGYEPPSWVDNITSSDILTESLQSVKIYYSDTDDIHVVKKLVKEREAVNIAMNTENEPLFQEMYTKLLEQHGYLFSGYRNLFEEHPERLPPNFAMYMTALFRIDGQIVKRHVINLIGYAFDNAEQPDYKYFITNATGSANELAEKYCRMFLYMLVCANEKGFDTIVLSFIGGASFVSYFPFGNYGDFISTSLRNAIERYQHIYKPDTIEIMDGENPINVNFVNQVTTNLSPKGITVRRVGRVPGIFMGDTAVNKLFVNAWDPHSIVGNGNSLDNSLDGFMGRISAMAYVSFYDVNPLVLASDHYEAVSSYADPVDFGDAGPAEVSQSIPTFSFPFRTVEAVPGMEANTEICRAEELSTNALERIWALYFLTHYNSPMQTFSGLYARALPSSTTNTLNIEFLPIGTIVKVQCSEVEMESCTVFGGIVEHTSGVDLPASFQSEIYDDVRQKIILRTGPKQQFDPYELFGFKLYLERHHGGGGSNFSNPYTVKVGNTTYQFWYNPTFSSVNMQESLEFYKGSQHHKIGISFVMSENELKINQIRESNTVVERINPHYMTIMNEAMQKISNTVRNTSYQFNHQHHDHFTSDICWLRRNADKACLRLYERVRNYPVLPMQITLHPPELVRILYPGDAIDAGGIKREFVTMLVKTLNNSPFVKSDDKEFYAKGFDSNPDATLTDEESHVYKGLGALIYFASRHHGNPSQRIVLGPVFTRNLYLYMLLNKSGRSIDWIPSVVRETAKEIYEQTAVNALVCSKEEFAALDEERKASMEAIFDAIDEDFIPFDFEWSTSWNESKWTQAKMLLCTHFQRMCRKYTLVYDQVSSVWTALGNDMTEFMYRYQIPYIGAAPINCQTLEVMPGHSDIDLRLSLSHSCSEVSRPAPRGIKYLILAAIYHYITNTETAPLTVRSSRDENGNPWVASVEVTNIHTIKYFKSHNGGVLHVHGGLNVVLDIAERMKSKIQGELNRDKIISEMTFSHPMPNVKAWLGEYLREITHKDLEAFVHLVTGSTRLLPGNNLRIIKSHGGGMNAHTCFNQLDIPVAYESGTKEDFTNELGRRIAES